MIRHTSQSRLNSLLNSRQKEIAMVGGGTVAGKLQGRSFTIAGYGRPIFIRVFIGLYLPTA